MSKLYFKIEGETEKPLLVLGHPLGMNCHVWNTIIPSLSEQFRILRWDLPGHGQSPAIDDHISSLAPDTLVAPLLAKCNELGIEQFHYIGTSIGGMVGLQLLSQHSDRLLSATLTNTGARIGSKESWSTRQQDVMNNGLKNMAAGLVTRWFSEDSMQKNAALAPYWQEQLAEVDNHSYGLLCSWLGSTDLTTQVIPSKVPVQLICGEKDIATTPELMQALASLLELDKVTLYSGIGHVPSVESPDELSQSIIRFIEPLSGSKNLTR